MKELASVQDYLLSVSDVGDWDGEEEYVADTFNAVIHAVWQALPDDMAAEQIDELMPMLWQQLRGDTVLLDADEDEIIGWAIGFVQQQIDEGESDEQDAADDDQTDDFIDNNTDDDND